MGTVSQGVEAIRSINCFVKKKSTLISRYAAGQRQERQFIEPSAGKQKRAYQYRCYPTHEQEQVLARTFGCVRFVYNWALRKKTDAY
jgi:Helix-turn-helix domain